MQNKRYQLDYLYRQYARPLYFYLLKLSGSKQLAEDLTQETFVRATISLHTYENEEARAWLFKVARNAYLDEWRKQQRWRTIPILSALTTKKEMISPYGVPEESLLAQELNEQLEDLLNYLPEQYRSIIYLREYEQFSYKEISESLQLTQDQVKITLYRARKRLADLAEKKGWQYDGME
ncbi:sigma-70 family RNA polymerase sigma factor [Sporosarcina thermotolerans]|uniref:Sigma-70 family RNA polymerase sigma factor n=1 Tax=Sporosarcina thermotolerans TaxID=633404 RepID=A0AAW9ABA4_9BACL|nr:sigma-70 family RNA polymerase sigma factor [Sporosarcina thermotolerans]MDW0118235.1 sigma-70 family RNA polymerase sigma factor [Sporosarcina thermotolerans]WHT48547.1 sigma-70 family RNA polymerase sigma factor [Sporosarcina thermotolerans]